jgi:tRNA 2-thiouridine synthesizing protein A
VNVHYIDGGELTCARLLALLGRTSLSLPEGSIIHLSTSDPVAAIDIPAWCHMTGNEYLGRVGDSPATYAVEIVRTAAS